MYSVNFVGLNYFNACKEGQKEALIPNGTNGGAPGDSIPMHNASLFIEADHVDKRNWWPGHVVHHHIKLPIKLGEFRTVEVLEFQIPKKEGPEKKGVQLNFGSKGEPLRTGNLDEGLPSLGCVDGFVLDPNPDTIANIPLPNGDLEVFQFGSAALVRWLISDHNEPITITVDGDEKRGVTLRKSDPEIPTEIVFSNTVDLFKLASAQDSGHAAIQPAANASGQKMLDGMPTGGMPTGDMPAGGIPTGDMPAGGMDGHHAAGGNGAAMSGMGGMGMPGSGHGFAGAGHFMLYAKLDKRRDESKFTNPKLPDFARLTPLPFSHPYLAFLSDMDEVPDGACVPSCC